MRFLSLLLVLLLLPVSPIQAQNDPLVERIISAVSVENLEQHVQTLQDFGTRYTFSRGNTRAGNWLVNHLADLGYDAERHEFSWGSFTEENIVVEIRGKTHPDEIVAISGHFDSTSQDPYNNAPGADDSASVIAGILEAARIFRDYQFERTIWLLFFNAEEQGRRGSIAVARDALDAGKNIVGVINADMIGYWPTGWQRDLDIVYEPGSEDLGAYVEAVANQYLPEVPTAQYYSGMCRDDHVSFSDRGFPAISTMDCWDAHNTGFETTPHYHRTSDTLSTLNLACMTQVVQINLASVAELAGPISLRSDVLLVSAAEGGTIDLMLSAGPMDAGRRYVMVGTLSGTEPGTPLSGGLILPLNWDDLSDRSFMHANNSVFRGFQSRLDPSGLGRATFRLPPGVAVGHEGAMFHFGYVLRGPVDFVSNPVSVEIIP